jgi:hypothetical protein
MPPPFGPIIQDEKGRNLVLGYILLKTPTLSGRFLEFIITILKNYQLKKIQIIDQKIDDSLPILL